MFLQRDLYLSQLRPHYNTREIKVIKGIRGSGKTTLVQNIIEELKRKKENRTFYIDMEEDSGDLTALSKDCTHIFIDECKNDLNRVLEFIKTAKDRDCSVFLISSSEITLPFEHSDFIIRPFSYKEYYTFITTNGIKTIDSPFSDYLKWGGFPELIKKTEEKQKLSYLENLYRRITFYDIFKRKSLSEEYKFNSIESLIAGNSGKDFKASFIKDFCNINKTADRRILERKTVYNYLDKMESAFLISRVKRYSTSDRLVLTTLEKHYIVDLGLKTIRTKFINSGESYSLRNLVYNELISQGYEVYTGKTYKGEIDFTVFSGQLKCFIQVCPRMSEATTIQKVFESFKPIHDASPRYVISLDRFDYTHDGITHINIEDFLLGRKFLTLL